jgi:hypothetical protein
MNYVAPLYAVFPNFLSLYLLQGEITNGSKTALLHVISFLLVSLGSSTVQLHDSIGGRRACAMFRGWFQ